MSGRVSFVGAGPGAADLITVRGARRIAEADIVLWSASLVAPECVREHARPDAELLDSSRLGNEEAVEIYRRAARDGLAVARVHSGDPALSGAVRGQYDACVRLGLEVDVVAGVSPFSAAAASAGRELTRPDVAQSVMMSRLDNGASPAEEAERVRELARHGATLALSMSAARAGQLVEELRAGGYPEDTPVLVCYKASWPDELLLHTTLGELVATVKKHKLWRNTLFLVGRALAGGGSRRDQQASRGPGYRSGYAGSRSGRAARPGRTRGEAGPEPAEPRGDPGRSASPATSDGSEDASAMTGAVRGRVPSQRPERQLSQPDARAAWWAVRSWQQTARPAPPRSETRRGDGREQSALFLPERFAELDGDSPAGAAGSASADESAALAGHGDGGAGEESPAVTQLSETGDRAATAADANTPREESPGEGQDSGDSGDATVIQLDVGAQREAASRRTAKNTSSGKSVRTPRNSGVSDSPGRKESVQPESTTDPGEYTEKDGGAGLAESAEPVDDAAPAGTGDSASPERVDEAAPSTKSRRAQAASKTGTSRATAKTGDANRESGARKSAGGAAKGTSTRSAKKSGKSQGNGEEGGTGSSSSSKSRGTRKKKTDPEG